MSYSPPWLCASCGATPPGSGVAATAGGSAYRLVTFHFTLASAALVSASVTVEVEDAEGSGTYTPWAAPSIPAGVLTETPVVVTVPVPARCRYRYTFGGGVGVTETLARCSYLDV